MRIARLLIEDTPAYATVDEATEDYVVLAGDPIYSEVRPTGARIPKDDARLISPVIPRSKVVAVGRNYAAHAAEMGNEVPEEPVVFFKPNTSVIGPDDPIVLPNWTSDVHHEAELAVVIGRLCKDVPAERANEVIYGYTCANDVSARDKQTSDVQWARAKGFDTSCPTGPVVVQDLDVSDLAIRAWVDGELRQDARTSQLLWDVPNLIAHVSSMFTLLPGDIILTGTPAGVGPIEAGQRVDIEIEGIGRLSNPVLRRD